MRLSAKGLEVLAALLANAGKPLCGADLFRKTGAGPGTIYPMLARFEQLQWVKSEWETVKPSEAGRPRKRMYTLTGEGARYARERLAAIQIVDGNPCLA